MGRLSDFEYFFRFILSNSLITLYSILCANHHLSVPLYLWYLKVQNSQRQKMTWSSRCPCPLKFCMSYCSMRATALLTFCFDGGCSIYWEDINTSRVFPSTENKVASFAYPWTSDLLTYWHSVLIGWRNQRHHHVSDRYYTRSCIFRVNLSFVVPETS